MEELPHKKMIKATVWIEIHEVNKSKKERPCPSKTTKKAMDSLKKNKKKFTASIYGWNATKDGSLVPNWKEQNNIDWMKERLALGHSASAVAKHMTAKGFVGKRGGIWRSTSVLRTVRYDYHDTRNEKEAPKWFKNRGKFSYLKK